MNQLGGNGGSGWDSMFKMLIGLNIDEFVESQVNEGDNATMVKVFDYVSGKEFYEKESVCEGSTH